MLLLARGVVKMLKGWQALKKYFALVLCGMSAITLTPSTNYFQFVTTPEQMTRKSWQRTGEMLRAAIEKVGDHERTRKSQHERTIS